MKKDGRIQLSVASQVQLRYFVLGLLWIVFGWLGLLPGKFGLYGQLSVLAAELWCYAVLLVKKQEEIDEMAEKNLGQAKSFTLYVMKNILLILTIVLVLLPDGVMAELAWRTILKVTLYTLIGLGEVLVAISFHYFEREE